MDLFKIYALKHTEVTIYLTILLQERTVILYQIAPARISSQITGYLILLYNVYAPIQFENRALRRIKDDALAEDLERFNVDQGCVDVYIIIEQYDKYLSDLLNKHAPKKEYICERVDD